MIMIVVGSAAYGMQSPMIIVVGRYDRLGLAAALFLLKLWTSDYCLRSASSSNPCVLVVMYSNDQLCVKHALTLFGAQCVGVTAGFQVSQCGLCGGITKDITKDGSG